MDAPTTGHAGTAMRLIGRWAAAARFPRGRLFDVQIQRPGEPRFSAFRTDDRGTHGGTFTPRVRGCTGSGRGCGHADGRDRVLAGPHDPRELNRCGRRDGSASSPRCWRRRATLQTAGPPPAAAGLRGSGPARRRARPHRPVAPRRPVARPVTVFVKLDVDPVALYAGGIHGLPATSPSVTGRRIGPGRGGPRARARPSARTSGTSTGSRPTAAGGSVRRSLAPDVVYRYSLRVRRARRARSRRTGWRALARFPVSWRCSGPGWSTR